MEPKMLLAPNVVKVYSQLQGVKRQLDLIKHGLLDVSREIERIENLPLFNDINGDPYTKNALDPAFQPPAITQPIVDLTQEPALNYFKSEDPVPECSKFDNPDPKWCREPDVDATADPVAKRIKLEPPDDAYTVVYTDGACENNGSINARAGYGVWFGENHTWNVARAVKGRATNNVAEIQACIAAIEIAKSHNVKKLQIVTDSEFCVNAMTKWIKDWKRRGWKLCDGKKDVRNKEDFQKLDALCADMDVKWVHVRGHKGVRGNEMADQLARYGAKMYARERP